MDRLGYLAEFERKCDEFLSANLDISQERMQERDKLIRLAKSAMKLRVVSNEELKRLMDHLDESLFDKTHPKTQKSFASLRAKSTLNGASKAKSDRKVSSFNHRMAMDKRWA